MKAGYLIPEKLARDIEDLDELIVRYQRGDASSVELKAHRVPFGIYEQRKDGTYMVRIRCAAGFVNPEQIRRVAEVAKKYGRDTVHLTTRQELQIHDVKSLGDIIPILKELKSAGLATRGGGGNTVRNIMAQPDAGIDPDEVFDVTPYAVALTTRLIAEDDSYTLPRKYKIAFSGSSEDKGMATVNDLGFIAKIKEDQKGFKVFVAGGMGSYPQEGKILFDFIEEREVYNITKAVKNLFSKFGNRKNKNKARLRFLWRDLGEEMFRNKFDEEYRLVKEANYPVLEIVKVDNNWHGVIKKKEKIEDVPGYELWKRRYVTPQKQDDLFSVILPVWLGDVSYENLNSLSAFLEKFGDNVIRITQGQNFQLRNIHIEYLPNVYNFMKKNFEYAEKTPLFGNLKVCAGASTCRLGLCVPRGAAEALKRRIEKSGVEVDSLSKLQVNFSGCPNSCGQHPVADLGFYGKALRKDGKLYPAYHVVAGAFLSEEKTQFAESIGDISSHELPVFVEDVITGRQSKIKSPKDAKGLFRNEGKKHLEELVRKHADVPSFDEDKNYYYDWGADQIFSLAGRGAGECSAGLFDLIEMDIKNIKDSRKRIESLDSVAPEKAEKLLDIILYSSRMLLITRGVDVKQKEDVYKNFQKFFIDEGWISESYSSLIVAAEKKEMPEILKSEKEVYSLSEAVLDLYQNMDASLNFNKEETKKTGEKENPSKDKAKFFKDLRGVACPMNFVQTKMELYRLKPGELLEIWLDDGEPIKNVPGSVREEGHKVIEELKEDGHWVVRIEKAGKR